MPDRIRMTTTTKLVLEALRTGHRYGNAIAQETGLATGTVYPILARLERTGWAVSAWEDRGPEDRGSPRRMYRLVDAAE